jgi:hypothetical protein
MAAHATRRSTWLGVPDTIQKQPPLNGTIHSAVPIHGVVGEDLPFLRRQITRRLVTASIRIRSLVHS